jgi:integrase
VLPDGAQLVPKNAKTLNKPKSTLNDRKLKSKKALAPAPSGKTYDAMDAVVPGLGVRVSETGRRTFILTARYPGSRNPTRRALGVYGELTLERARDKARDWLEAIRRGTDPRDEEERLRKAEERKGKNSFDCVVEDYIKFAVIGPDPEHPRQRGGDKVARELQQLVPVWDGKPIAAISREDVQSVIKSIRDYGTNGMLARRGVKDENRSKRKDAPAPGQARNSLGNLKTLFTWAIKQNEYGIELSPCRDLNAKTFSIEKTPRNHALNDTEAAALWRATRRLGYPYRQVYRLLLLTGLRLNEVVDASWGEFDLKDRLWTIPASRMKGTASKARPHAVPLVPDVLAILGELPRFKRGDYLFSLTNGASPCWIADKIKKVIDAKMLLSLRAFARLRGDDPARVKLVPWVNHDLRRTMRTGLSKLRIDHDVKEAVLAHAKPGLIGTYDTYDLRDEKHDALLRWSARVREIVEPPPPNVVKLQPARA